MNNLVSCPHCKNEFPLDQVVSAQLDASIRGELETEFSEKTRRLVKERSKLAEQQKQLKASQEQLDEQVQEAIAKERGTIESKARVVAQQAVAVEIKDRDQQLKESAKKIEEYQDQELQLRQKTRQVEEQAKQQRLEVERQLDEDRNKIRQTAIKETQDQNSLRLSEVELKNKALLKQVDDMKQQIEQGSQQTQGEVLEIVLEELLASNFSGDVIKPVAKGVKGADILHHVFDQHGRECGVILWESKRTKRWDKKWLSKIIDDQQEAKATCACVVSTTLPDSIEYLGEVDGVWISSWPCALSAAIALRRVLIEAAKYRRAADGQQGKQEMVYNYLAGPEFYNRVNGIAVAFIQMQVDLAEEKRAIQTRWNRREKQIERALASTSGLHGDLQGIIGNGLQEIEGMDLLALEVSNEVE